MLTSACDLQKLCKAISNRQTQRRTQTMLEISGPKISLWHLTTNLHPTPRILWIHPLMDGILRLRFQDAIVPTDTNTQFIKVVSVGEEGDRMRAFSAFTQNIGLDNA